MNGSEVDLSYVDDNAHLAEKDFITLSRRFLKAINPVIVSSIRKKMGFETVDFEIYRKDYLLNQPNKETDLVLDMTVVPLVFFTQFGIRFFPKLEDEYWSTIECFPGRNTPPGKEHSLVVKELNTEIAQGGIHSEWESLNKLKTLEISNYHSLTYAAYEIENHCKSSFFKSPLKKLTDELEIIPQFFCPLEVDSEFLISLVLHINLILY